MDIESARSTDGGAGSELVEEVARDGSVLRLVTRAQMRAEHLRHRSVFIAVVNDDGQLLVHRRADHKDVWPGAWDLCVGGVAGVAEDWRVAAERELAEELGVDGVPVMWLGSGVYEGDDVRLVAQSFLARCNGPFEFADGEITEAHWVAPEELMQWLRAKTFLPDSLALVLPRLDGFTRVMP